MALAVLRRTWLPGAALMLIAFNLRPALSAIGPLLASIRETTSLSATGASVLTTVPVLCLGLTCALVAPLIRRAGLDIGVLVGMAFIVIGLALCAIPGLAWLFCGTAVAAIGIGIANVLLPAIFKRDFANRVGLMTGLYTAMLSIGAAAGAGLTVPIEQALARGWPVALASWSLPAIAAALAWLPFARRGTGGHSPAPGQLLRQPLAWCVTAFMGLQSSLAYTLFGWLPFLLQDRGLSPVAAGLYASLTSLSQVPGALLVAALATRGSDQRFWIVAIPSLTAAAFLLLTSGPMDLSIVAAVMLGIGVGGSFALAVTLILLRAGDVASAADLSAMAQGGGYVIACLGPLAFGLAHDATGGWGLAVSLFVGIAALACAFGLPAGRDRKIGRFTANDHSI